MSLYRAVCDNARIQAEKFGTCNLWIVLTTKCLDELIHELHDLSGAGAILMDGLGISTPTARLNVVDEGDPTILWPALYIPIADLPNAKFVTFPARYSHRAN